MNDMWRCFYCDETFADREAAALHFGTGNGLTSMDTPGCQIDLAEYRRAEAENASYREEDAAIHRQMRRMESEHRLALRRAEEAGYAKGLADSRLAVPECTCPSHADSSVWPHCKAHTA